MSSELRPPEPWHSFLRDLDDALQAPARLDCIGGFVVTQLYGLARPTADVDVIELAPREASEALMQIAMQGGPLHRKHRIYLDRVAVAVRYLSRTVPLDLATLQQRYETELRWQLGRPDREDLTMKLWMEMLSEQEL